MREADQRLEAENTGAALDRVHPTEHRIDGLVGVSAVANVREASLDLLQGLVAFVEERLL